MCTRVCVYVFDSFTYSDGTEFELRFDDVVVVLIIDFLPHLDFFRLAVLTLKCFENCKNGAFLLNVLFCYIFLVVF